MNKLVLIILCVLLPPIGVFFAKGAGKDFLINIVLTILFWFPGMIHALWITTR
ncbi:YqaE/Pmp3 family membrane protein [Aliivibrio sp. 1S128]|uniref:YqaE/Pmp3 family membrane protein n=1 Tax=Aliivibrio sp. 1S128 TaxID=1840085 RepID=UPI00080EC71F|nr:YqaE/Pmp3 family membrane protein [Aliivibrio sp. 1S128]OCH16382.1 proteolipid membrane potential modulator [Aliivibrio sp. 1S128]